MRLRDAALALGLLALPGPAGADGLMLDPVGPVGTSTILRPYPYNPGDGREGFADLGGR